MQAILISNLSLTDSLTLKRDLTSRKPRQEQFRTLYLNTRDIIPTSPRNAKLRTSAEMFREMGS